MGNLGTFQSFRLCYCQVTLLSQVSQVHRDPYKWTDLAINYCEDSEIFRRYSEILGDRQTDGLGHVGLQNGRS